MFEASKFVPPEIKNKIKGPAWEDLKITLLATILTQRIDVFSDEESKSGKWAPLKPSTIKRKNDSNFKILHGDGILRNSFTEGSGQGSEFKEEIITNDEVTLATNVEYAAIHNYGGTINHPGTDNGFGRGIVIPAHTIEIEARPFNEFTDEQTDEISSTIEDFLNE